MTAVQPGPTTEPADRSPAAAVDVDALVAQTRDGLRDTGRRLYGVTGDEQVPSLLRSLRRGQGVYPLIGLGLLNVAAQFQGYAVIVLGPEISRTLGISKELLAALLSLRILATVTATLPVAALVQRVPRRALLAVGTGLAGAAVTFGTTFVVVPLGLALLLVVDGAMDGSVRALHRPLLMDSYPPGGRVRVLSAYRASEAVGNIVTPLLVGVCTTVLALTWRGTFFALGALGVVLVLLTARLRDPGFGRYDEQVLRQQLREQEPIARGDLTADEVRLGFFEIVRRLMLVPTVRRILAGQAVLGMMLVPFNTYLIFFLDQRWGLGPGGRAVFFAGMPVAAIAALAAFSTRGESLFQRDPGKLLERASVTLGVGVLFLGLAVAAPWFWLMAALFSVAFAAVALSYPMLDTALLSVVPATQRPHAAALAGVSLAAVGGFGGLLLLSSVSQEFGTGGAIVSIAVPGLAAGIVLRTARATVGTDLDRLVDGVVEEEEVAALRRSRTHVPMLSCRGIDFAYGQLQVLFDVDFTVDEGEMVALLGTNGAGKSTLLRVVSGLGLPRTGSVRYRGQDITYVDAERRVRLGITQVPGGKAVFPPLTVVENMRVYGTAHGRSTQAVDAGLEASFAAFPRLAERRNALAGTLSGGEQQMLALSKALILQPRLLLIDELSLGLAPKVVGELLDMVRAINARGTAVVLVEQSVNVALSLVDHAYFMEKGQVRFDGPAKDLLGRGDLLRSVFLQGAVGGLGEGSRS
jgi:ABC-type branched-subunit amino acid transport system ATPase component/MFS family permease